jgi:hypothetical protein
MDEPVQFTLRRIFAVTTAAAVVSTCFVPRQAVEWMGAPDNAFTRIFVVVCAICFPPVLAAAIVLLAMAKLPQTLPVGLRTVWIGITAIAFTIAAFQLVPTNTRFDWLAARLLVYAAAWGITLGSLGWDCTKKKAGIALFAAGGIVFGNMLFMCIGYALLLSGKVYVR